MSSNACRREKKLFASRTSDKQLKRPKGQKRAETTSSRVLLFLSFEVIFCPLRPLGEALMPEGFIPPHGGYQQLLSYRKAEIVYDATVYFPWS
jgi:hypothetical protein